MMPRYFDKYLLTFWYGVPRYYIKATYYLIRMALTGKRVYRMTLASAIWNVYHPRGRARLHWLRDAS